MDISKEETTPDQLMESFKGHGLKTIILFTVIVHVVVIGGSSIPYFIEKMGGGSAAEGKVAERLEAATREAKSAIQEIVKAEEVSDRFTGSKPAKAAPSKAQSPSENTKPDSESKNSPESGEPESEIEKEIKIKEDGPKLPGIGGEAEDLFK